MQITVKATGAIHNYLPDKKEIIILELAEPMIISKLLTDKLALEPGVVMAVLVDGQSRKGDYLLTGGEEVILVAPLGGG